MFVHKINNFRSNTDPCGTSQTMTCEGFNGHFGRCEMTNSFLLKMSFYEAVKLDLLKTITVGTQVHSSNNEMVIKT